MAVMDISKYNSIVEEYRRLRKFHSTVDMQFILDTLIEKYSHEGLPGRLITNLIAYVHQCDTRYKVGQVDWTEVYNTYKKGNSTIISISKDLDISPTIVAKKFLMNLTDKITVKTWLQDSSTIPDGKLAMEVMMAQYADPIFGQLAHCVMSNAGELFECEVASVLKRARVCYASENSLRAKEFDVTPDFKLNIPLAISVSRDHSKAYILPPFSLPLCQLCKTDETTDPQRLIVCWIECKALFASPTCHKDYLKYQFNSYANRFGHGLVLYKYGFVRSILKKHPKLTIVQELVYHECKNPVTSNSFN